MLRKTEKYVPGSMTRFFRHEKDTTERLAIDAEKLRRFCESEDPIFAARIIFCWTVIPTYGMEEAKLRKELGMDSNDFRHFLIDAEQKQLLKVTKRTYNSKSNVSLGKVWPVSNNFVLGRESEGCCNSGSYKIDCEYFSRHYRGVCNDKTGLRDLGMALRLIGNIDYKYGLLVSNPNESDYHSLNLLNISDIAKILGVSRQAASRFMERAKAMRTNKKGKQSLLGGPVRIGEGKTCFILNPRMFYHRGSVSEIFFWDAYENFYSIAFDQIGFDQKKNKWNPLAEKLISRREEQPENRANGVRWWSSKEYEKAMGNNKEKKEIIEKLAAHTHLQYNMLCWNPIDLAMISITPFDAEDIAKAIGYKDDPERLIRFLEEPICLGKDKEKLEPLIKKMRFSYAIEGYVVNPKAVSFMNRCFWKEGRYHQVLSKSWADTEFLEDSDPRWKRHFSHDEEVYAEMDKDKYAYIFYGEEAQMLAKKGLI